MRYSYRSYNDSQLQEEFRGEAQLDPPEAARRTSDAKRSRVGLPPGTIFPTDHIRQVLAKGAAGERFVSHQVFDGAGFDP